MTKTGSKQNPLASFGWQEARDHWKVGQGAKVFVAMHSHMTTGGRAMFSIDKHAIISILSVATMSDY